MKQQQSGFSLLEVLVAFVIMALSLGVLYQAAGGSTRAVVAAEEVTRATILAESLLALHAAVPANGLKESGTTADGMSWSLTAERYTGHGDDPAGWPLYRIEANVAWGEGSGRSLALVSLVPERKY